MADGVHQSFFHFVRREKAVAFFHYAVVACRNVTDRAQIVGSLIEDARGRYKSVHPEILSSTEYTPELAEKVKQFHYEVLEIVEKLTILTEALFRSISVVKQSYKRLPFAVLRTGAFRPEIRWAPKARLREIAQLVLLPRPASVFRDRTRRQLLRKTSSSASREIMKCLKRAARFHQSYEALFNKYKHTIAENTGYAEIGEAGGAKSVRTIVFFEDYSRARHRRARPRPCTLGLIASLETLAYFEQVLRAVVSLHKILLTSRLQYLYNEGAHFVPDLRDFLTGPEAQQLSEAIQQEPTFRPLPQKIKLSTVMNWTPQFRASINKRAERRNFVFRLRGHIVRGRKTVEGANIQVSE